MIQYYKIAGIVIKVIGEEINLIEELEYQRFETSCKNENYTVNFRIVNELGSCQGTITYQDEQNIIYDDGKYRYVNNRFLIKKISDNYYNVFIKKNCNEISIRYLFNAMGFDALLAKEKKLILHASFIAKISACAVARFVVSRKLCAHEITSLFLTITAPTGTSSFSKHFKAS